MENVGVSTPSGTVAIKVSRSAPPGPDTLRTILRDGLPRFGLSREVFAWRVKNLPNLWRGLRTVLWARFHNIPTVYGALRVRVIRSGVVTDYGLASLRVVTTAGVTQLVNAFLNTFEPELFKFHGIGTGTNAEAAADTVLQTELTTQYNPDSTRATGTQAAQAANIYRTVATNIIDSGGPIAIREHGIFSSATVAAGTLLDRSVFGIITLNDNDAIQTTYDLTLPSGS